MKAIEKRIIRQSSKLLGQIDKCPIIYYHDIVPNGEGYSYQKVDISVFEEQIRYIANCGIKTLTFGEIETKPELLYQKRNLIITFDDGYKSNYEKAYPVLKKYSIRANIFVVGKEIVTKNKDYISESNMKEMYASGIIDFGAHTWSHIDCDTLNQENYLNEVIQENEFIKKVLEKDSVSSFCFPYGSYNKEVLSLLNNNKDYKYIFTSDNRSAFSLGNTIVRGRVAIENNDSLEQFSWKISGLFGSYYSFKKLKNMIDFR